MSYNRVRVPPNPKHVAEILVLRSSLGAKRKELNAGRAVCDLLEIKRVHCKVIDFNTDARAGFEDGENEALAKLKDLGRLIKEGEDDLALPLVFIDGWRVGDNYDLQDLEDDGILGRILRREVCVNCHEKKDKHMMNCFACKTKFVQIIVDNKAITDLLSDYYDRVYTSSDLQDEDDCSEGDSDLRYAEYEGERHRQKPKPAPFVPKERPKWSARKSVSKAFSEKRAIFEGEMRAPPMPPIIAIVPPPEEAAPAPVPAPEDVLLEPPALVLVPPEAPEGSPAGPLAGPGALAPPEDPEPRMVLSVHDFLAEHEGGEEEEEDKDEGRQGEVMTFAVNQDAPSSLEMARRMVLNSMLSRKQVADPTRTLARVGSREQYEELEELPMLSGHMWKKSPNPYRLRSFQWRFFIIREAQVTWWKYKEEAPEIGRAMADGGDALCNGYINLRAGPVEVILDEGNDTTFSLRPFSGTWEEGAIGKGDTGKAFTFDTTQSEHTRSRWARDIAEHSRRLHGR